jgi:hypothetical protein
MVLKCSVRAAGDRAYSPAVAITGKDAPDGASAWVCRLIGPDVNTYATVVSVPDMLIGDAIRDLMLAGYAVTYDREASAEEA